MNTLDTASLVNLLGFTVGAALYALLLVMVARYRRSKTGAPVDLLLLATAILGLLWNVIELAAFFWNDFGFRQSTPFWSAISYSALGFLPSVVVHSARNNSEAKTKSGLFLTVAAYALSIAAGVLHFKAAFFDGVAPSSLGLQILTVGSLALRVGSANIFFGKGGRISKYGWPTKIKQTLAKGSKGSINLNLAQELDLYGGLSNFTLIVLETNIEINRSSVYDLEQLWMLLIPTLNVSLNAYTNDIYHMPEEQRRKISNLIYQYKVSEGKIIIDSLKVIHGMKELHKTGVIGLDGIIRPILYNHVSGYLSSRLPAPAGRKR